MNKLVRRIEIVDYINERGKVSFGELKQRFPNASDMTLRTDLKELDAQGKIIRIHGGARTVTKGEKGNDPFFLRDTRNIEKRQQIAKKAAALLRAELIRKPTVSIYMDAGVTITEIAKVFPDEWCSIVTNSISTAYVLSMLKKPSVTVLGGLLNRINCSCDSIRNMEELERMNFDLTFLPTAGYTEDADFTCTADVMDDMRNIIIRHSKKIIIPMDSTKIGRVYPSTHTRLSEVNTIISDDEFPQELKERLAEKGVEVL